MVFPPRPQSIQAWQRPMVLQRNRTDRAVRPRGARGATGGCPPGGCRHTARQWPPGGRSPPSRGGSVRCGEPLTPLSVRRMERSVPLPIELVHECVAAYYSHRMHSPPAVPAPPPLPPAGAQHRRRPPPLQHSPAVGPHTASRSPPLLRPGPGKLRVSCFEGFIGCTSTSGRRCDRRQRRSSYVQCRLSVRVDDMVRGLDESIPKLLACVRVCVCACVHARS